MGESAGNFELLGAGEGRILRLARLAERHFAEDPPGALIKLRQLGEFMAKDIAARHGPLTATSIGFDDVLRALKQDPNDEPASVLLDRIRAQRAAAPKVKRGRRSRETADA